MSRANRRGAYLLRLNRAGNDGRMAHRLGITLDHCPYYGKRTGFRRALADAWIAGWKEADHEARFGRELDRYIAREKEHGSHSNLVFPADRPD